MAKHLKRNFGEDLAGPRLGMHKRAGSSTSERCKPVPTYVAMLRGINVSGQKIIKMQNLRDSFEALGFRRVRTYLQSGNVIFETVNASSKNLSKRIEEKISSEFGFSVPLVLRTSSEMTQIVDDNSFLNEKGTDDSKLHVTFLSALPPKGALKRLEGLNALPDRFFIKGREVYLYCPDGYGRTKLSNNTLEKLLSLEATTRNWRTVSALATNSSEKNRQELDDA